MARNACSGICYRCGLPVKVGTGHFERNGRRWRVRHHDHARARGAVTCDMAKTGDSEMSGKPPDNAVG